MTTYNKETLSTFFITGAVPQGSDFANLINSQVNIVETSAQQMAGPLGTTELIASRISAGNTNITGMMTIAGQTSAAGINCSVLSAATINTGVIVATSVIATGTVSAQSLFASTKIINSIAIISAAGTAQATSSLCSASICRLAGVVDGQTTGFSLMGNRAGWNQKIYGANLSANLYPPVGGTINALGANAAFSLAVNTLYDVVAITNSAYAVK